MSWLESQKNILLWIFIGTWIWGFIVTCGISNMVSYFSSYFQIFLTWKTYVKCIKLDIKAHKNTLVSITYSIFICIYIYDLIILFMISLLFKHLTIIELQQHVGFTLVKTLFLIHTSKKYLFGTLINDCCELIKRELLI